MIQFLTVTRANDVLAIHQTLKAAQAFAADWAPKKAAQVACKIVAAERGRAIKPNTTQLNTHDVLETFSL